MANPVCAVTRQGAWVHTINLVKSAMDTRINILKRFFHLLGKVLALYLLASFPVLAAGSSPVPATSPANPQNQPPQPVKPSAPPANDDLIDSGVLEGNEMMEGGLEISGMMSDETTTKFGHEFFDAFHRAWKPLLGSRYNITINERVDPLRGSMVSLRLDQNVIYEGFLSPRTDAINDLAAELAKEVNNLVRTRQNLESELEY